MKPYAVRRIIDLILEDSCLALSAEEITIIANQRYGVPIDLDKIKRSIYSISPNLLHEIYEVTSTDPPKYKIKDRLC